MFRARNIDIYEIAVECASYGSYPSYPKWNPICDLNDDGKVDIQDLARMSAMYGKIL